MLTISKQITMEDMTCGGCGLDFCVPQEWIATKRREAGSFTCPNGCQRTYRESDADRLRKQLEVKERELRESKCETLRQAQLAQQESLIRQKAEKKLRRVNRGVCPCCNRTFENLARHMAAKHAENKSK